MTCIKLKSIDSGLRLKRSNFQVGFGSSDSDILGYKHLNLTRYLEIFGSGLDRFLSDPDRSWSIIKMLVILILSPYCRVRVDNSEYLRSGNI